MNVVLHTCCGPCACACVPVLKRRGHAVTLLFANSNIDTRAEFDRRKVEAERLARIEGVPFAALPYDHADWLREVARGFEHEPETGERCARCFRYNLRKTAAWAREKGLESFTTSLTVSPLKVSRMVFDAAAFAAEGEGVHFLPVDFKQNGGSAHSVRRAKELELYRQTYCGCEFSKFRWRLHHRAETASTNLDARDGTHGDVYVADYQTAGRGRLDHRWLSPPGMNVMMSVVLGVDGLEPGQIATLPLVAGLAVARGLAGLTRRVPGLNDALAKEIAVKWPNDVLVGGRKIAGILCERHDDVVIVGIGVNVRQRTWPDELKDRATSIRCVTGREVKPAQVRNAILSEVGKWHGIWKENGFAAVHPSLAELDCLRGRELEIRQTDDDACPVRGVCGGIRSDGTLDVGGVPVHAGEAHVVFSGISEDIRSDPP